MNYADYVFDLEGFDGLEGNVAANPLYQEYSGLLKVIKLPSLSRMNLEPASRPLTADWAFKVRRKQFIVQVSFITCKRLAEFLLHFFC